MPSSTNESIPKAQLFFGDGLGWKAPEGLLATAKEYLQFLFPQLQWKINRKNNALDILKLKKQTDSYSCGCYLIAAARTLTMREGNGFRASQSASVVQRHRQHCVESNLSLIIMAYAETKHRNLSDIEFIRYMKETAVARRIERSAHNESHPFAYNKLITCKRASEPSAPVEDDLFPGAIEEVSSSARSIPLMRRNTQTVEKSFSL